MLSKLFARPHIGRIRPRSFVVAASASLAMLATTLQPVAPVAPPSVALAQDYTIHPHWMADNASALSQRQLKQAVLPGSHDSGTYGTTLSIAQAQDIDIFHQLQVGARLFDFRATYRSDLSDYYFYHGGAPTDAKLSDAIDQIAEFYSDPANSKEFAILGFGGYVCSGGNFACDGKDNSDPQMTALQPICNKFKQEVGPMLLTPSMVPHGRSLSSLTMQEIWNLPNHPRVMTDWGQCVGADGTWPGGTFAGYYANQCYAGGDAADPAYPGIINALGQSLDGRLPGTGNPITIDSSRIGLQSSPAPNLYELSVAATPSSLCLNGVYELDIHMGGQVNALDAVKQWFDSNQMHARANLNLVYGDYVEQSHLVDYSYQMDQAGPQMTVNGSKTPPIVPLEPGQTVTVQCQGESATYPPDHIQVGTNGIIQNDFSSPGENVLQLGTNGKVAESPTGSHSYPVVCADTSGREAHINVPVGSLWALGPTPTDAQGNRPVLHFDATSSTFKAVDGGATGLAVGPDGQPWLVNASGQIWRRAKGTTGYVDGKWQQVSGTASAIAVGDDGSVWALGSQTYASAPNRQVLYLDTSGNWDPLPGGGVAIAVADDGRPWVVNSSGEVWQGVKGTTSYANGTFQKVAGVTATDIAAGPGGQVWAIGKDSGVWQYTPVTPNGGSWTELGGGGPSAPAGVHIAVDALGTWVVNSLGQLWRYGPDYGNGNWTMIGDKGTAALVGVS